MPEKFITLKNQPCLVDQNQNLTKKVARIHTISLSTLERFEYTKFYNSDDVIVIVAAWWLTKTTPISFYNKHDILQETMPTDVNKVLTTRC